MRKIMSGLSTADTSLMRVACIIRNFFGELIGRNSQVRPYDLVCSLEGYIYAAV